MYYNEQRIDIFLSPSRNIALEYCATYTEYLSGTVNYGNDQTITIKSRRRETTIGKYQVHPNGSIGVYLNNTFKNIGNKAELILHLQDTLLHSTYC